MSSLCGVLYIKKKKRELGSARLNNLEEPGIVFMSQ